MFKHNRIISEIHLFNRWIGILLIGIFFLFAHNFYWLFLVAVFFLWITFQHRVVSKLAMIGFFTIILSIFIPQILWISKAMLFSTYLGWVGISMTTLEFRYAIESIFYPYQNKKITTLFYYFLYFYPYFKKNLQKLWKLKNSYGFFATIQFLWFIIRKALKKTKIQLSSLLLTNQLRFYNKSKTRTMELQLKWKVRDGFYISWHIAMLFLIFF